MSSSQTAVVAATPPSTSTALDLRDAAIDADSASDIVDLISSGALTRLDLTGAELTAEARKMIGKAAASPAAHQLQLLSDMGSPIAPSLVATGAGGRRGSTSTTTSTIGSVSTTTRRQRVYRKDPLPPSPKRAMRPSRSLPDFASSSSGDTALPSAAEPAKGSYARLAARLAGQGRASPGGCCSSTKLSARGAGAEAPQPLRMLSASGTQTGRVAPAAEVAASLPKRLVKPTPTVRLTYARPRDVGYEAAPPSQEAAPPAALAPPPAVAPLPAPQPAKREAAPPVEPAPAAEAATESPFVQVEREELRQLVEALQTLRTQKAEDAVAIRALRDGLRSCAALAMQEAPGSRRTRELIARLEGQGLL